MPILDVALYANSLLIVFPFMFFAAYSIVKFAGEPSDDNSSVVLKLMPTTIPIGTSITILNVTFILLLPAYALILSGWLLVGTLIGVVYCLYQKHVYLTDLKTLMKEFPKYRQSNDELPDDEFMYEFYKFCTRQPIDFKFVHKSVYGLNLVKRTERYFYCPRDINQEMLINFLSPSSVEISAILSTWAISWPVIIAWKILTKFAAMIGKLVAKFFNVEPVVNLLTHKMNLNKEIGQALNFVPPDK